MEPLTRLFADEIRRVEWKLAEGVIRSMRKVQVIKTVSRVYAGDNIPMPVREDDGALTGWRTKPAPHDGVLVSEGEACILVGLDMLELVGLVPRKTRKKRG